MQSESRCAFHSRHALAWCMLLNLLLSILTSFAGADSRAGPPGSRADTSASLSLEDLLERGVGEDLDQEILERLLWAADHPIDLNDATEEDFLRIPGVPPVEVEAIQRHRRSHGPFKDLFGLAGVQGVTWRTWLLLRPFFTVSPRRMPLVDLRSRVTVPLDAPAGADTAWLGSGAVLCERLVLSPGAGWECGVVAASDAGERVADGFVSAYLTRQSAGNLRRVIIGDFTASGGPGLVWGQAMRMDALLADRNGGFNPHRSSGEQGFLRGMGVSAALPVQYGELRVHAFASRASCAASLDTSGMITSLSSTTAFTTAGALRRRNAAHVAGAGMRVEFLGPGRLRLGITANHFSFDHDVRSDGPFDLSGRKFGIAGGDALVMIGQTRWVAEYAASPTGIGYVAGVAVGGSGGSTSQLVIRHCDPGFHSILALGGAFGDAVRNRTEVRWNLELTPFTGVSVHAELAQFRKLWPTATMPFSASGREVSGECSIRLAPGFLLNVKGEERWVEGDFQVAAGGREKTSIIAEPRRRIQCTGTLTRGSYLHLRGRFEVLRFSNAATGTDEHGWMVFGDLRWDPALWLRCALRMTLFQTDSYASRLYSIESNVEGLAGSVMFSGTGRRWSCLVMCRPFRSLQLSGRYVTLATMGGNRRIREESEVTLQLEMQVDAP